MKLKVLKKQILTITFALCIVGSNAYAEANIIYAPTTAPSLPKTEVANSLPQNNISIITPEAEVASVYEYTASSIDFYNIYNVVENNNNLYCYENGGLVKNGWRMISKASFAQYAPVDNFRADYIWAFFTSTGKALKASSGKVRKAKFGKYYYAFNDYGQLLTGFFNDNGEMWSENDDDDPFDLLSDGNNLYHANELNGNLTEGWYKLTNTSSRYPNKDSIWLYFMPSSCKLARSTGSNYKSVNIDGKTYAFDDNGVMLTGFEATQYNIDHGGNPKNVYFGTDGAEIRSGFFTVDMSDESNYERFEEYENEDDIKIYLNKGGKVYSNTMMKIGSSYYGFDQNGVMITGLSIWNNGNYMTTIDTESTDGKSFINEGRYVNKNGGGGTLQTSDVLHYFDKSGRRQSTVSRMEFSDNEYSYGASNSGAYNGKHGSKYYVNGILLKPRDGAKYGVYVIPPAKQRYSMAELSKANNIVVDRNGNSELGNSQIRDEDDNYWLISNSALINVYSVPVRKNGSEYYFKSTTSSGSDNWIRFGEKDAYGRTCVAEVTPNGTRLANGAVSMYQTKLYQDSAINFYIN